MSQWLFISPFHQRLYLFEAKALLGIYPISTAKNGLGEQEGSLRTPRGWHSVCQIIGLNMPLNSVYIGRRWTGEIYSAEAALLFPQRDWILTRIIRLRGEEFGLNYGLNIDSFERCIYIHGTPDNMPMGIPLSHGCIRMRNDDIQRLADWISQDTKIYIHSRER